MDAKPEYHEVINAVSNRNRLAIIALLSQKMQSAAELASEMDNKRGEVDDHLSILSNANLISRIEVGDEIYFKFNPKTIEEVARQHLSRKPTSNIFSELDLNQDQRRIISHYTNQDGRLRSIPTKSNKLNAVLEYMIGSFDIGVKYKEGEVNHILSHFYDDTTTLRRLLIDYKLLDREKNGTYYWRLK